MVSGSQSIKGILEIKFFPRTLIHKSIWILGTFKKRENEHNSDIAVLIKRQMLSRDVFLVNIILKNLQNTIDLENEHSLSGTTTPCNLPLLEARATV